MIGHVDDLGHMIRYVLQLRYGPLVLDTGAAAVPAEHAVRLGRVDFDAKVGVGRVRYLEGSRGPVVQGLQPERQPVQGFLETLAELAPLVDVARLVDRVLYGEHPSHRRPVAGVGDSDRVPSRIADAADGIVNPERQFETVSPHRKIGQALQWKVMCQRVRPAGAADHAAGLHGRDRHRITLAIVVRSFRNASSRSLNSLSRASGQYSWTVSAE